ncbi:hypothetical protein HDU96_007932 [Phlyctochytrium bullatum]|nr:hypothetical protein HDU96_007932 [Phlyctochytrium bullatum]
MEAIRNATDAGFKGEAKAKAIIEGLKFTLPKEPTIMARIAWNDPTPENIELVETLLYNAVVYFTPESEDVSRFRRRGKSAKKKKLPSGAAFLNEQYGLFLKLLKNDFTLSQLYFKTLTLGDCTFSDLSEIFYRMDRAERECSRYYSQLYSRFGYVPRVLQQYADFLDLVARVEEADAAREELQELMEEVDVDDQNITSSPTIEGDVLSNGKQISVISKKKSGRKEGD